MFEVFKATNGNFYWRLKAANGEILCHSEGYTAKQNAFNSIDAVKRIAVGATVKDLT